MVNHSQSEQLHRELWCSRILAAFLNLSTTHVIFCRLCLQSRHHWLLTVAAEGVVRLLYPLRWQHVYIPVMPSSLADYLEVSEASRHNLTMHNACKQQRLRWVVGALGVQAAVHAGGVVMMIPHVGLLRMGCWGLN